MTGHEPAARALPIEVKPWRINDVGLGGVQHLYRFSNGYGASVISDGYGGDRGLYELAVIRFDGGAWMRVENTPVTNDVLGWLTVEDVARLLVRIAVLPPWKKDA